MRRLLISLLLASFLSCVLPMRSYAQAGSLDTAFNPSVGGILFISPLVVQPDGKILVGGLFGLPGDASANVVRLNADGTKDSGFSSSTDNTVQSLAIQTDGKIILGGNFSQVNGVTQNHIARLNSDGSLDTSFTGNANSRVNSLAIQSDGKIVLGGNFTAVDGTARTSIARLNANGSLDLDFDASATLGGSNVQAIAVQQADGKILLGGNFGQVNGVARFNIARLNANGSLDTIFNASTDGTSTDVNCINCGVLTIAVQQTDGKILLGGGFTRIGGTARTGIGRLNPDGTLDTSFNATTNFNVLTVAVQSDGKILLVGPFYQVNGAPTSNIARLFGSTSVHPAFFSGEVSLSNGVYYLQFPNGMPFGYYSYLADQRYIYHFDLGYEYLFDANDGKGGVYLYDFASKGFFYTSPSFGFPYLYDFSLNAVLYYYPDSKNSGRFTTNPRYFFNFKTGQIITK